MSTTMLLAFTIVLYLAATFSLAAVAHRRIDDLEDYVVAGRRLGLPLAAATLLATWFGAGTLLAAADEVHRVGLSGATLDPLGAGLCLILAGAFMASRLWNMKLTTMSDLFARRFDRRIEALSALLMIPPYFGWLAAQFMAVAGMLDLFFGLPMFWGLLVTVLIGTAYTLVGGMWAVTLTDAMQLGIVIVGLIILLVAVTFELGDGSSAQGFAAIFELNEEGRLVLVDVSSAASFMTWLGILCAGALGNLPSQDIMQRIFSSKSATVARRACYLAGAGYLVIGAVPVILGLSADLLIPAGVERAVLPMLADVMLHPALAVVLVVSLLSTIMSTIDSAILAPATVMAKNVVAHLLPETTDLLRLSRVCVAVVAAVAFGVALMGENAYALLESGYELGMVSLLVPLIAALYDEKATRLAALVAMLSGTLVWLIHAAFGAESFVGVPEGLLPLGIGSTALSALSYLVVRRFDRAAPQKMVQ